MTRHPLHGTLVWVLPSLIAVLASCNTPSPDRGKDDDDEAMPSGAGGGSGRGGAGGAKRDAGSGGQAGTGLEGGSGPGPSPALDGGVGGTFPPPDKSQAVFFSEIMYHPVKELAPEDVHEFLELHNRSGAEVSLAGWKITGDVTFTFPAGAVLRPGAYLVVAKNRKALAQTYGLPQAELLGDYMKELDNDKGTVTLTDAQGKAIETVTYTSSAPWPIAADAMGAEEEWLPPALQPMSKHQHKGQSLERLSFEHAAGDPANWEASAVDLATPGKKNGRTGPPRLVARRLEVGPAGGAAPLVGEADEVRVRATLSDAAVAGVKVRYFVEDFEATGEAQKTVAATAAAPAGTFEATLPPQKANSVVRYQFLATEDGQDVVVSPRETDPLRWHAYFVSPPAKSASRQYHLFINTGDWDKLWTNAMDGHIKGCNTTEACKPTQCEKSAIYNQAVPATFVFEGKVYDVYARYQGSRYGRKLGPELGAWSFPRPKNPNPLLALSWSVKFPRHARFEGRDKISLNKSRDTHCAGMDWFLGAKLARAAGIPSFTSRYVRVNVNGGYYQYMREWIEDEEQLIETQIEPKGAPIGELYEAKGFLVDEGPYAVSDNRPITGTYCGYTALQRYQETYELKTNKWVGHDPIIKLNDELEAARATKNAATVTKFLKDNFEWEPLLAYMVFQNWSGAWDDTYHNFSFYRRPGTGKWILIPWDLDGLYGVGSWAPLATSTPYLGMEGATAFVIKDLDGKPTWSRLKDAVMRYARAEYNAAFLKFIQTVSTTQNVDKWVDDLAQEISVQDAMASPAWTAKASQQCNFAARQWAMKKWARDRNTAIPGLLTATP
jgi:hypothetical protein